uniref:Caspase-1-A n=2 Tax=Fundulus heteroclitus TaxID=8078 RepID=A0A3Q2PPU9_FUNHE
MAATLMENRTRFVDRCSKEVINQLLDDLLLDGIINDGEKESILEENNSRADKARNLIDVVRMKGDVPSMALINHLQQRDPMLHALLLGL